MFKPFISANMIIAFLLLVIIVSWLRGPKASSATNQVGLPGLSGPERIAAYEEIWRREESGLWDWLEERIGMQDTTYPASSRAQDQAAMQNVRKQRQKSLKGLGIQARLAEEAMSEREMEHAIQVTEERLSELKSAVLKNRILRPNDGIQTAGDADSATDEIT